MPMGIQFREFFEVNRAIIIFVYGEAFFVLGLAIALQSWRHTRLSLARALPWLAAFGFAHGLHEWGALFIPIQAAYLSRQVVDSLIAFRAILLALSFSLLFQFGIEMLRPLPDKVRAARYLPLALFVVWLWYSFGIAGGTIGNASTWYTQVSNIARYAIGIVGAATAAYGLYRQRRELKLTCQPPENILHALDAASFLLLGYAALGGLFVLPADFFPADRLNSDLVYSATWVPVEVWRGLLGLGLAIAIIRALELFRIEVDRRLGSMEEQQVLLAERDRIGRELHDGTLQAIYAAGLLLRAAEKDIGAGSPGSALERIRGSIQMLDKAIEEIRDYIGVLRAEPTVQSLKSALRALVDESPIRALADVEMNIEVQDERRITPVQIRHLLAITAEALSNVARHANARHVSVLASATEECLCVEISDDGDGLPSDYVVGYGLRNMQERARLLGGDLTLASAPGHGTTVRVKVPWSEVDETVAAVAGR